jgi:hypothetical protein
VEGRPDPGRGGGPPGGDGRPRRRGHFPALIIACVHATPPADRARGR